MGDSAAKGWELTVKGEEVGAATGVGRALREKEQSVQGPWGAGSGLVCFKDREGPM